MALTAKSTEQQIEDAQKRLKDAEHYKVECETAKGSGTPLGGNLQSAEDGVQKAEGGLKGLKARDVNDSTAT